MYIVHQKENMSGLFWDKMNSEIFSYLEFHTVDEEKRAQVENDKLKFAFSVEFKILLTYKPINLNCN